MARVTIEDCLDKVNNRFSLVHVAAKRVRHLRKGVEPTIISKNTDIVLALREIAAGNVVTATKIDQNQLSGEEINVLPGNPESETGAEEPDEEKGKEVDTSEGS